MVSLASRLLKKGSECFEGLSMNDNLQRYQNLSIRPELRRRTPREFFSILLDSNACDVQQNDSDKNSRAKHVLQDMPRVFARVILFPIL